MPRLRAAAAGAVLHGSWCDGSIPDLPLFGADLTFPFWRAIIKFNKHLSIFGVF